MDKLTTGWDDYWEHYKKVHGLYARYPNGRNKPAVFMNEETIEQSKNTNDDPAPRTIAIKKEKKIIHIKL